MSKKILTILAIIAFSVSLTTILPAKAEARFILNVFGYGSYYAEFLYNGNLDPEDTFSAVMHINEAYVEYENPNNKEKTVIVGYGGRDDVSDIDVPAEIIGTDDQGNIIIRVNFPATWDECNNSSITPYIDCPDSGTGDKHYDFLEFYGLEPYKDNWTPIKIYLIQVELNGVVTNINPAGNVNYRYSDLYDCITTAAYRDGDDFDPDYICNISGSPFAIDDDYIMKKDVFSGNVTDNDFDREGDPLTAEIVTPPSFGTLDLNPDGSFTYEKGASFTNEDFFEYRVRDSENNPSNTATANFKTFK